MVQPQLHDDRRRLLLLCLLLLGGSQAVVGGPLLAGAALLQGGQRILRDGRRAAFVRCATCIVCEVCLCEWAPGSSVARMKRGWQGPVGGREGVPATGKEGKTGRSVSTAINTNQCGPETRAVSSDPPSSCNAVNQQGIPP